MILERPNSILGVAMWEPRFIYWFILTWSVFV